MVRWLFALLAMAPPPQAVPPAASHYIARAWSTGEGLPQNTVTTIVQTRDGYLWLGTFGGLVRFDGHAFTVFDPGNTPGLASARIVVLHEDRTGVLWIGTESGLSKYDQGRFTSYTTRDGLPHMNVLALLDDSRGRLWIGTGDGLVRFDGRAFERVPIGPPASVVLAMAETPDGAVWVSTNRGIERFAGAAFSVVSEMTATVMLVDAHGRLWICAPMLMRWDPAPGGHRFVDVAIAHAGQRIGGLAGVIEDRAGTLWVAALDGVVYRLRDRDAEVVAVPQSGIPRGLLSDREGNIWFGTDVGGLTRLKRRQVFSYPHDTATGQSVGPIVGDGANGLWIGGTCGDLVHFHDGRFDRPVMDGCIWALLRDPDGTLWTGAGDAGLRQIRDGRITSYTRADGVDDNIITALARDRDGTLWVGHEGGLSRFDNGRFTDVGREDGLRHRVLCIEQDHGGALWIGGGDGVYRIEHGRVTGHYTTADGLSHDLVRAIHEDADGVLWIGTYGGGLNRFKDGHFTSYGLKEGLPDTAVSRIVEDERGNFWMSGNRGIYRVARSQLNAFADGRIPYLTSVTYGTADGMIIEETNGGSPAGWRTPDGRVWFPTIKGLVGIEPIAPAATAPPVVVESLLVDGRSVGAAAPVTLGAGSVDAEFHYTAIDLRAGEKTRFRYRLANYDPAWIDGGTRRVAYYTKIPPGRYRFEVMATDSDGAWGATPARLAVVVTPLWWQRQWVVAAALLLLLAVTAGGVRHVSLRRTRVRLEELERERALDRERTRIARDLHDDLGSRLAQIALIAEQPAAAGERVAAVAREAMRTMDELVWTMNARNDTAERFAEYAAEFAEEHLSLAGIRFRLQFQAELDGWHVGADTRRDLFLAFKEAIHNVVKHAQASEVRISLRVEGAMLTLEIVDNGRGLPAALSGGTGNGLHNMRERMQAAGGRFAAEAAAGGGTRIVLAAPAARTAAV